MDEITNSNKYCNIQESCKLLIQANNQYDKVVQQNQSLQQELNHYKNLFKKIECGCKATYTRTNECRDFKKFILSVIKEVKDDTAN